MADTYSTRLRIRLMELGSNLNTWGSPNLNNDLSRIEDAIAKVFTKAVSGNYSLTSTDEATSDEARSAALILTGAPGATYKVTIPSVEKTYIVYNTTANDQTIGTASGAAATVRAGMMCTVVCNATDSYVADARLDQIKAPTASVAFNGQKITALAAGANNGEAINWEQLQAVYAYAAGIANSGILAPGTTPGQFLQWNGTAWAQAAIPPLLPGTNTTVSGSFTAGTMAVNVDFSTLTAFDDFLFALSIARPS